MSDASLSPQTPEVYTGYYGEFTITAADRQEVFLYRLGLAIAADLVGKMAGDIEVYSPTIGLPHTEALPGSTFMLWLKVASNPHQVTSAELPQGN